MTPILRVIRTSSRENTDMLSARLQELDRAGFQTRYDDLPVDPNWTYMASSVKNRLQALQSALTEKDADFVICARGGYGASDLLPRLDWPKLATQPPKLLVGYSDVSALHSALYAKLGWPGLHAPMPATVLWRQDGINDDVDSLLGVLKDLHAKGSARGALTLTQLSGPEVPIRGRLYGGCFSVLSSLIGTPYFPKSLAGHIVFLEDTGENPARLTRYLNQWLQAGLFSGVVGIVIGYLRQLGGEVPDCAPFVLRELATRIEDIPVYHSPFFGHTSPNYPLMIGADAVIDGNQLVWTHGQALNII